MMNKHAITAIMRTFKPSGDFEKDLAALLKSGGHDVDTAPKYDELPLNKLNPAQVYFYYFYNNIVILFMVVMLCFNALLLDGHESE